MNKPTAPEEESTPQSQATVPGDAANSAHGNGGDNGETTANGWLAALRQIAFQFVVLISFVWTIFGVCFIYGMRLWYDQPPHASFMPIVLVSYSVVTSLIVVLTLEWVVGRITVTMGKFTFDGAAAPIILWIVSFLAIATSMAVLVGTNNSANDPYRGIPLQKLWGGERPPENRLTSPADKPTDTTPQ